MPAPRLKAILVSTLGLEPELFFLTTGTFNLFVKDRITLRLSAVNSVQIRTHERASACPRNLQNLNVLPLYCQPTAATGFPRDFHRENTRLEQPGVSTREVELFGGDRTQLPPYVDRILGAP